MFENVQVLDCTIRDGGYINNWDFSEEFGKALYRAVSKAGCSYMETGFYRAQGNKIWNACTSQLLSEIKRAYHSGAKISLLVDFQEGISPSMFLPSEESGADMLRVVTHKATREKAVKLASGLSDLGYETTVNFMGISNYSNAEVLELATLMEHYRDRVTYFYLADSFGSLIPSKTKELFEVMRFGTSAKLGFHPHNNLQLAFANVLAAVDAGVSIVDGSVLGMGRGGGNVCIEALLAFFQEHSPEKFSALPMLDFIEIFMEGISNEYKWGYSLPQVIAGVLRCHPHYPTNLLKLKSYSAKEVYDILKVIPEEQRGQYREDMLNSTVARYQKDTSGRMMAGVFGKMKSFLASGRRKAMLISGGSSVGRFSESLKRLAQTEDRFIVGVNSAFSPIPLHAVFFGNARRYAKYIGNVHQEVDVLLGPSISVDEKVSESLNMAGRVSQASFSAYGDDAQMKLFPKLVPTNSGIEALLCLAKFGFNDITIAGMDGYSAPGVDKYFYNEQDIPNAAETLSMLDELAVKELWAAKCILDLAGISFRIVTPTLYQQYHEAGISEQDN